MLEMEAKDKVREKIGGKLPSPKRCPLITSKVATYEVDVFNSLCIVGNERH